MALTSPAIPKTVGIAEGDRVKMKAVKDNKMLIRKTDIGAWQDCTDSLSDDFEKGLAATRTDSTQRFKRLRLIL